VVMVIQMALFLFSATFVPLDSYPVWVGAIVQWTPLYQAVVLLRGITTGSYGVDMLVNIGYLTALGMAGLLVAGQRMSRVLTK